jgi:hypothetical protein
MQGRCWEALRRHLSVFPQAVILPAHTKTQLLHVLLHIHLRVEILGRTMDLRPAVLSKRLPRPHYLSISR